MSARAALLLLSRRSSLVLAACSAEDILRCPMCRRSQPHKGEKSQHAPKLRKTGPTRKLRKLRNRKILHHNKWNTATSIVVFAKIRRCDQTTLPNFCYFPTPALRAEMVCPTTSAQSLAAVRKDTEEVEAIRPRHTSSLYCFLDDSGVEGLSRRTRSRSDTTTSEVALDEVSFSSACRLEQSRLPALFSRDEIMA